MVHNLREKGALLLEEKRLKEEDAKRKGMLGFFTKSNKLGPQ
jgi:hypothetical protein